MRPVNDVKKSELPQVSPDTVNAWTRTFPRDCVPVSVDEKTKVVTWRKTYPASKYKPHQGKRECARRISQYVVKWFGEEARANG